MLVKFPSSIATPSAVSSSRWWPLDPVLDHERSAASVTVWATDPRDPISSQKVKWPLCPSRGGPTRRPRRPRTAGRGRGGLRPDQVSTSAPQTPSAPLGGGRHSRRPGSRTCPRAQMGTASPPATRPRNPRPASAGQEAQARLAEYGTQGSAQPLTTSLPEHRWAPAAAAHGPVRWRPKRTRGTCREKNGEPVRRARPPPQAPGTSSRQRPLREQASPASAGPTASPAGAPRVDGGVGGEVLCASQTERVAPQRKALRGPPMGVNE